MARRPSDEQGVNDIVGGVGVYGTAGDANIDRHDHLQQNGGNLMVVGMHSDNNKDPVHARITAARAPSTRDSTSGKKNMTLPRPSATLSVSPTTAESAA